MLRVTWEWLGQGPAFDLANTVAIVDGAERDLIASDPDYARWARCEARFLPEGSSELLESMRAELLDLRAGIRGLLASVAAGEEPRARWVGDLNRASRGAPAWPELDAAPGLSLREVSSGTAAERLLAWYARSAMNVVADEAARLRRCPAPSCGMFYLSTRGPQVWCSTQCGTRARVARHHASRRRRQLSRRSDGRP